MKKSTKTLLIVAGVAAGAFLLMHAGATKMISIVAYDGSTQSVAVDQSLSPAAENQIRTFFGPNGTMMMSTNPAADVSALETSLRQQGFSAAATGANALYQKLLTGAHLTAQGFARWTRDAGGYGDLRVFQELRPEAGAIAPRTHVHSDSTAFAGHSLDPSAFRRRCSCG